MDILKVIASHQKLNTFIKSYYHLISNPDIILNKIGKNINALESITYDPHINSLIQSRKAGVLSLEWQLIGKEQTSEEKLLLEEIFNGFKIYDILNSMLNYSLYGHTILEVLWQYKGKYVVPVDLVEKPQDWFSFDNNNLLYFINDLDKHLIPHRKFLLLQNQPTYKNPYGRALLSMCYLASIYKKEAVSLWLTFAEKFGMPHLHAKVTSGLTDEAKERIKDELDNLRQDAIAVFDGMVDVSSTNVSVASGEIYKMLIDFFNEETSKAILSQTLTTQNNNTTGSFAMSKTHMEVRQDVVDADKRIIENKFNELIEWIVDINFGYKSKIKFQLYAEEDVDLKLAQRDATLINTKNLQFTKDYFMREYGLKENDLIILEPVTTQFAETKKTKEENDSFDLLANSVDKLILNKALSLIETGDSFENIENSLLELYPDLNTNQIEDILTTAIITANYNGRSDV